MIYKARSQQQTKGALLAISLALLLVFLLSACGADPQVQQRTNQNKAALDRLISNARATGVPNSLLAPIVSQENKLSQTSAPLSLFSSQPVNDYNTNLAQGYQRLALQLQGLEKQTTEQYTYQASLDMQTFEDTLSQPQIQQFSEAATFAAQLSHDQTMMAKGQYPKDFTEISINAKDATQALHLLGSTYSKYTALKNAIAQLQGSNLDTTALDQQTQNDLQLFRKASNTADFTVLDQQLNVQMQSVVTLSTLAIPYVGAAKLQQFSNDIDTMKQAGIDTTQFQQKLDADRAALAKAKTLTDYTAFSTQLDNDIASTRVPLLQANAQKLVQQFHQEVQNWGNNNQWTDPLNGQSYTLDYEYADQGIGSDLDADLQAAQTADDYQGVIDLANNDMFNLKLMEADATDQTALTQPHATDAQAMKYYNATSGQTVVVSLIEQSLRLYQNGQLVKAFPITSGQFDKPSLPGFWQVIDRESPTVFKSGAPVGSAFWYPDTNINFAIGYHSGGYFLHDSWWRYDYGLHTNFPHNDSSGNQAFAGNGSHGCINIQEDDAGWLYQNTSYSTQIIIY